MKSDEAPGKENVEVEHIKHRSRFLRGTIVEGLKDRITGAIPTPDTQLSKFHGMYQQDDRDLRLERQKQKLEPLYSFMIRVRLPGGVCSPSQYLALDHIARTFANNTLRLTTRQTFQFHGVLKGDLRPALQEMHRHLIDCIAACGDVNRNVMCNPNPDLSSIHGEVYEIARALSEQLLPRTRAYYDIWIDGEKVAGTPEVEESEPIYGKRYLPRKFKTAFAVPPSNDVDVYANDLGYIAIVEEGKLVGFNVLAGGGMGMSHGEPDTYPRLASILGFCPPDKAIEAGEAVLTVQRDFGDRTNRKHARLKYTIDDRGVDWYIAEVNSRLNGWSLTPARPFTFEHNGDRYGWVRTDSGSWHLTIFVMNGRVRDDESTRLMSALREIAGWHTGEFRMTANQNIIIANVPEDKKGEIEATLARHGVEDTSSLSAMRLNAMACVAFPTCGLAMAESERYLPDLLTKIETMLKEFGLENDPITIRMTGCPNGCARPYIAEIAFVGKAPGKYNMYLGAGFHGERLNKMFRENIGEEQILEELRPLLAAYAKDRQPGEHFGDFVVRTGVIKATREGRDFHE